MLAVPVVAPAVANDVQSIRLIGRKMAVIKANAETQTTAKRTALTNAMPGDRESIEEHMLQQETLLSEMVEINVNLCPCMDLLLYNQNLQTQDQLEAQQVGIAMPT